MVKLKNVLIFRAIQVTPISTGKRQQEREVLQVFSPKQRPTEKLSVSARAQIMDHGPCPLWAVSHLHCSLCPLGRREAVLQSPDSDIWTALHFSPTTKLWWTPFLQKSSGSRWQWQQPWKPLRYSERGPRRPAMTANKIHIIHLRKVIKLITHS